MCDARCCLSTEEDRQALKVADCLKRFTRECVETSVLASPKAPAVLTHMSDGWGAFCDTTSRRPPIAGTHLATTRTGRFRHEFLLQRGLFRHRQEGGEDRLMLLVGDPEGLNKGKGAWNVFAGCIRFARTLREMGHTGVCGNVYIMDGALYTSLARKLLARHRLQAQLAAGSDDDRALLDIQEFTICIKCLSHGCPVRKQRWGLGPLGWRGACFKQCGRRVPPLPTGGSEKGCLCVPEMHEDRPSRSDLAPSWSGTRDSIHEMHTGPQWCAAC